MAIDVPVGGKFAAWSITTDTNQATATTWTPGAAVAGTITARTIQSGYVGTSGHQIAVSLTSTDGADFEFSLDAGTGWVPAGGAVQFTTAEGPLTDIRVRTADDGTAATLTVIEKRRPS